MHSHPITLERAIANFKKNSTPENAQRLITLIKEGTFYLLIHPSLMRPENAKKRQEVEEQIRQGHVEKLPLLLFNTESEAGTILPVFTNRNEMAKFPDSQKMAAIQVTFPPLYLLVKSQPKIDNLLINPEGHAIAFNREQFLQSFDIGSIKTVEDSFKPGTVAHFEQGINEISPKGKRLLIEAAIRHPEIEALWIVRQLRTDTNHRWFVILDVKPEDQHHDTHTLMLDAFLRTLSEEEAGMMYADNEAARDVVSLFEPLYRRQDAQSSGVIH
ncbi:SseB family protein [Erysipelotrichaceae bacterium 51-3]